MRGGRKVYYVKSWKARTLPRLDGAGSRIRLYDTAAGRLAELPDGASQGLYVCGITPYDATHLGHAATYIAFDLLHRLWLDSGATVNYVQNVTDVDDPLLERAAATGVDWQDLARQQTDLFRADMEALNVLPPTRYVGAVESVAAIVPVVEDLVARSLAYTVPGDGTEPDGDVYFSLDAAGRAEGWSLGVVSGLDYGQMLPLFAERGGDPHRLGKRNALDPLLWRVARPGEPQWEGATLGSGRPGWHIECAVIARRYLPAPFTVQGGGSDLVFPHHEMSAAHAHASTGQPLAHHYAHAGMVGLDGEKMSKSRGNLVLVSMLRSSGIEPAAIRLAVLANHYRQDWSWSQAGLHQAQQRLAAWGRALSGAVEADGRELQEAIREALAGDLDAPTALAAVDAWALKSAPGTGTAVGRHLVMDTLDALLGVRLDG
jgi:L-cysteine:1D-myo-inositol 2-amino-2-deoxy-alpha-D-glucopyranoside ligase